jgi:acetyltransferase
MEKPIPTSETFILRNGTPVAIRPIRPDDAPRLQALLTRLSSESIFFRFLQYLKTLTPEQAGKLANVDHRTRMALVAALEVNGEEWVIAVARYSIVQSDQPDRAEVGIVVEDAYQNQGLGSRLLDLLTDYARDHGIRYFTGAVSAQNARILRFIRRSGLPTERKLDLGTWEIEVKLDDGL